MGDGSDLEGSKASSGLEATNASGGPAAPVTLRKSGAPVAASEEAEKLAVETNEAMLARLAKEDNEGRSAVALGDGSVAGASSSRSSSAADPKLMDIVGPGLKELAKEFDDTYAGKDPKKIAAANFIKALNGYVIELGKRGAAGGEGGSRRALKRIMKKYSRRVSRSRRQRGKRVKPSAQ